MAEKEKRPLFREKSMEKIESPEQLNTYIKVSNAGVWMMMAAIIVFLVGALVWGILGRIDVYGDAVA
ncbi:MAG: NHLP bacteriocin system secretion protein, partial [Lachnospiraceae bacterium]|nr:NHLP bacteriocin system secretion protein [Lachnospiraceae bacterium]